MTAINTIYDALRHCDYPDWTFKQVVNKIREKKDQLKWMNPKSENSTASGRFVLLP